MSLRQLALQIGQTREYRIYTRLSTVAMPVLYVYLGYRHPSKLIENLAYLPFWPIYVVGGFFLGCNYAVMKKREV